MELKDEGPGPLEASLYRNWGKFLTHHKRYEKAMEYYEKSLEIDPNQVGTLVELCDAQQKSGHFRHAARTAHKCMEIDPTHLLAEFTRVEALFYIGEFGGSLVHAHRAVQRGNVTKFKPMVLVNQETVEDCVGRNVPRNMLEKLLPWMKNLFAHREWLTEKLKEEPDEFAGINEDKSKFKVDDPKAQADRRHRLLDAMIAKFGLGEACRSDKFFMLSLLKDPALKSANKAAGEQLAEILNETLDRLQRKQEVLWTRRPIYSIQVQMEKIMDKAPGLKREKYREFLHKKSLADKTAKYLLKRVHLARISRDYESFFKWVDQTREVLDSFHPPNLLEKRDLYLDILFLTVARAYLDPRNLLRFGDDEKRKTATLQRALGLKTVKLPRDCDVAWPVTLDLRARFQKYRELLALTGRPLEIAWIYHELCKLFIEVKRYGMVRFYSKKVRDLGEEYGFEEWVLHGHHIVVRIELAQMNRNEAKEAAELCLESAKKLGVKHLVDFYEKAIAFIETMEFRTTSESDNVVKRKKLMSALMPADLRPKMDLLLNTLEAIPARRRMSIMPGSQPKRGYGRKMTIQPRPPPNYVKDARQALLRKFAPKKGVLGLIDFEQYD